MGMTSAGSGGRLLVQSCTGLALRPSRSLHDPIQLRDIRDALGLGELLGAHSAHEYSK